MLAARFLPKKGQSLRTSVGHRSARTLSQPKGPQLVSQKIRSYTVVSNQKKESELEETSKKEQEAPKKEEPARDQGAPGGKESVRPSNAWTASPYFTALLVVGTGLTAYGLYGLYNIMTMWPTEVRSDLRSGLRAKRKGDLETAALYLSRAWQTAKTLPLEKFGDHPIAKITGIGIALGGVLEEAKKLEDAYREYEDIFWFLRTVYLDLPPSTLDTRPDLGVEALKGLTRVDRMRAVALSYKLAELAHTLGKPPAEEKWLVWSVDAIFRTLLDAHPIATVEAVRTVGPGASGTGKGTNVNDLVEQLGLPAWSVRQDIAAPFEALGTFYARAGNISFALPLYLQAISILLLPTPYVAPVEDKCRGAQLMGNVAELIVRNSTRENAIPEAISQAEAWAKKGLDVVTAARKISPIKCDICEETYAMLLYNVGMIRELSGDIAQARTLLKESLEQSKAIGMEEGIKHAEEALRALDAGGEEIKPFSVAQMQKEISQVE